MKYNIIHIPTGVLLLGHTYPESHMGWILNLLSARISETRKANILRLIPVTNDIFHHNSGLHLYDCDRSEFEAIHYE